MIWTSTSTATDEAGRSLGAEGLAVTRVERDQLAQKIIAKAAPRPGQTTLEHVCPKGQSWDDGAGGCVAPPEPEPAKASLLESTPTWGWIAAATGALVLLARKKPARGGKVKRARSR